MNLNLFYLYGEKFRLLNGSGFMDNNILNEVHSKISAHILTVDVNKIAKEKISLAIDKPIIKVRKQRCDQIT